MAIESYDWLGPEESPNCWHLFLGPWRLCDRANLSGQGLPLCFCIPIRLTGHFLICLSYVAKAFEISIRLFNTKGFLKLLYNRQHLAWEQCAFPCPLFWTLATRTLRTIKEKKNSVFYFLSSKKPHFFRERKSLRKQNYCLDFF